MIHKQKRPAFQNVSDTHRRRQILLMSSSSPPSPSSTQMWTEILLLNDITRKAEAAVQDFERRYKQRQETLHQTAKVTNEHAMQLLIRAWFDSHYRCPNKNNVGARTIKILRSTLLDRINTFLASVQLPRISKKHPLWRDWFLPKVLQLEEPHAGNGKPILLEKLDCCVENLKRRLIHCADELKADSDDDGSDALEDDAEEEYAAGGSLDERTIPAQPLKRPRLSGSRDGPLMYNSKNVERTTTSGMQSRPSGVLCV